MTTDIDQQQLIVAPQFFRESPNTLRVTLRDGGKVVGGKMGEYLKRGKCAL
mgnify:FL=1